jgi:hypothetical protein
VECNSHKRSISPGVHAYWLCICHTSDWNPDSHDSVSRVLDQHTPTVMCADGCEASVCAMKCTAVPSRAVLCCAVRFGSVRCCSVLFCSVLFCSVLFCAVPCCSVRYSAVRCSAGRCCAGVLPGATPRDGSWSSMEEGHYVCRCTGWVNVWRGDGSFRTLERTQLVATPGHGAGSLLVAASYAVALVCRIALSN